MQELAGVGRQELGALTALAGRSWLHWVAGAGCTKTDISSVAYKTPCIFYREGMILGVGEPIQLITWLNL